MQVILTKDVDNLGEGGEICAVSDGYARNFLFPKKLAVLATAGALKDREMRLGRIQAKAQKQHQENLDRAAKVEKIKTLTLAARAGETGKLYGAVTTKELARLVSEKTGLDVDRKSLTLSAPINHLGEFDLQVRFSSKVKATLKISVVADEDSDVEASFEAADSIEE